MPNNYISEENTAGHKEIIGETIAKLILHKNGFNPYSRFLDKEAIDLIVRNDKGEKVTYNEIQVKYSKKYDGQTENYWFRINQNTFKPRHYFYFMFICETDNQILIIPSLTLETMLKKLKLTKKETEKSGRWHFIVDKKESRYVLRTTKDEKNRDVTGYLNNFGVLK